MANDFFSALQKYKNNIYLKDDKFPGGWKAKLMPEDGWQDFASPYCHNVTPLFSQHQSFSPSLELQTTFVGSLLSNYKLILKFTEILRKRKW